MGPSKDDTFCPNCHYYNQELHLYHFDKLTRRLMAVSNASILSEYRLMAIWCVAQMVSDGESLA